MSNQANKARYGGAWQGVARHGLVWCGEARQGSPAQSAGLVLEGASSRVRFATNQTDGRRG